MAGPMGIHLQPTLITSHQATQVDTETPQPMADLVKSGRFNLHAADSTEVEAKAMMGVMPETTLNSDNKIINKLVAHAFHNNIPLNNDQIRYYVGWGEHILKALTEKEQGSDPAKLKIAVGKENFDIESNVFTATAMMWAMYAMLAKQGKDLADEGMLVIKDPDQRIGKFLRAAPTHYHRTSSHFNERSETSRKLFFKEHHGIESYHKLFPSERGALLFSNIKPAENAPNKDDELFLKVEKQGMPSLSSSIRDKTSSGFLESVKRWIRSIAKHGQSYQETRTSHTNENLISFKEHVHKDGLKKSIWEPFQALVKIRYPDDDQAQKKTLATAKKHGMGEIERFLGVNKDNFDGENKKIYNDLELEIKAIHEANDDNDSGIGRRGQEQHLNVHNFFKGLQENNAQKAVVPDQPQHQVNLSEAQNALDQQASPIVEEVSNTAISKEEISLRKMGIVQGNTREKIAFWQSLATGL